MPSQMGVAMMEAISRGLPLVMGKFERPKIWWAIGFEMRVIDLGEKNMEMWNLVIIGRSISPLSPALFGKVPLPPASLSCSQKLPLASLSCFQKLPLASLSCFQNREDPTLSLALTRQRSQFDLRLKVFQKPDVIALVHNFPIFPLFGLNGWAWQDHFY